jgi:hypothetical protein
VKIEFCDLFQSNSLFYQRFKIGIVKYENLITNLFMLPTEVTPVTVSWHPMVLIAVIMDFSQMNVTSVHNPI